MHIAGICKCAAVRKSKGWVQKKNACKKHSNPYLLLQEVNNIWQRKRQGTVVGEQWLPDEMHDGPRDAYKC